MARRAIRPQDEFGGRRPPAAPERRRPRGAGAGCGRGGEKNFEGTVTDLQMGGYLLIRDFRQRINKKGLPYGWPISVYTTPEALWGYDHIASAYSVEPEESKALIYEQTQKNFPDASQEELDAVLGWPR